MARRSSAATWSLGLILGLLTACAVSDAYAPPPTQQPSAPAATVAPTTPTTTPAVAVEELRERWGPCTLTPGRRCRATGLPWLQSNKLDEASRAALASWKPEDGVIGVRVDESGQRSVVAGCQLPGEYSEIRRGYAVRPPDSLAAEGATKPSAPSTEDVQRAKEEFLVGQQAFERGDYRGAYEAFEAAYKHAPRDELATNSAQALALAIDQDGVAPDGSIPLALERLEALMTRETTRPEVRKLAHGLHARLHNFRYSYGLAARQSRRPESVQLSWEGFLYRAKVDPDAELSASCEAATHALVSFARWRGPTRERQLGAGVTGILVPLGELAARESSLESFDDCFAGVLYESCEVPVATMERFGG